MAGTYQYAPVFLSTDETKLRVSRDVKAGRLRKIGPRLYTPNVDDDPQSVIQRNLWEVVGLLFPATVVGYRTALEGRPSPEGTVNVVGGYDRLVALPGLTIRQIKGPGPLEGDRRFMRGLWLASQARAYLECLRPSIRSKAGARGLPREEIERRIEQLVRISGEDVVNRIRDEARAIAGALDAQSVFNELNGLIGSILSIHTDALTSPAAMARASGEPYDPARLERFQELHGALVRWPSSPRIAPVQSSTAFANAAFVDAYFSNYIEGTEFGVEEAMDIVFGGRIPEYQPEDAHDVLGTFRIVSSRTEMGLSMADERGDFQGLHLFPSAQLNRRVRSGSRVGRRCAGGRTRCRDSRRPGAGAS